ncbi:unnamed protein product [Oikopleura dioica]|uniref:Uncharacterized protein n=1 Tax=Oikopleura dioica TaxID=34765 RepID=E4WZQ5_OIKDI|nr:unnamed protein product [Oikopleura dioica]
MIKRFEGRGLFIIFGHFFNIPLRLLRPQRRWCPCQLPRSPFPGLRGLGELQKSRRRME